MSIVFEELNDAIFHGARSASKSMEVKRQIDKKKYSTGRWVIGLGLVFLFVGLVILLLASTNTLPGYFRFFPEFEYEKKSGYEAKGNDLFYLNRYGTLALCEFICDTDGRCKGFERNRNVLDEESAFCWFKSKLNLTKSEDKSVYKVKGVLYTDD